MEAALNTESTPVSQEAWALNKRCVHALAYWLQAPGQRWQDAHLEAWMEWAAAWDPDEDALDFAATLVNHLRLNLDVVADELVQLSVIYWLSGVRVVLGIDDAETDEQCERIMDSEHLEVVVDNGPILRSPNPNPPTLVVKESSDPGQ